ncbi:hypothetical protein ATANTOWER_027484, partial [Ataeniobius toweri]|nr:hypothetical protein [Ataeniobius toweri]
MKPVPKAWQPGPAVDPECNDNVCTTPHQAVGRQKMWRRVGETYSTGHRGRDSIQ